MQNLNESLQAKYPHLEFAILPLSQVNKDNESKRIDSEYFKKSNLKLLDDLYKYGTLQVQDIAIEVTDGIHTTIDYDTNSTINLISASSPQENYFTLTNECVSPEMHANNPRTAIQENDVIVSTVGTIGNCAVATKSILPANSSRSVGIIRLNLNKYSPFVLSTFLVSKYGRVQTLRESTGNVQLCLFIHKLKELKIPQFSQDFQLEIQKLVQDSHKALEDSKRLYKEAQELLYKELELDFKNPLETLLQSSLQAKKASKTTNISDISKKYPHLNISVRPLSKSLHKSGRLDSEYYQSKYDAIERKIRGFETIKLKDLVDYPISSGATPKAGGDDYTDSNQGIPFLRAVDLKNSRVETANFIYIKPQIHKTILKRTQLKKGDILFSIAGTIGRCAIFDYDFEANINQALSILRFNQSKGILRFYLITFFNSQIGQIYLEKYSRQGLQTNLNLEEVGNLEIPKINPATQEQIALKIQKSFTLRTKSKDLLESAKVKVEQNIQTPANQA